MRSAEAERETIESASRPRILVFAYSCSPGRGSEPGVGWGVVRAVATFADCTVLVGPEHGPRLDHWRNEHPSSGLSFVEVPEIAAARCSKWHRIPRFLIYLSWLRRAKKVAHRLHRRQPFDFVHHVTFSTYWLPSPVRGFDIPSVWGPVGGAVTTPFRLWIMLGWRGVITEIVDLICVRLSAMLPATRRTWSGVTTRIAQNDETLRKLPARLRSTTTLLNHVLFTDIPDEVATRERQSHILYVSQLESRKGPRLAICALAHTPRDLKLVMVGDGPERPALERLARRLNVADRVRFLGNVPRERVLELLADAAAVVFTGLREEGGVALAEAMLAGTPTIVLAHGGARTVAQSATDSRRVTLVEPAGPRETARRLGTAMTEFFRTPVGGSGPNIDQEQACRFLRKVFDETAERHAANVRARGSGRRRAMSQHARPSTVLDAQTELQ